MTAIAPLGSILMVKIVPGAFDDGDGLALVETVYGFTGLVDLSLIHYSFR